MNYRLATLADAEAIAALHAQSWQLTYRGILNDAYLDGGVLDDRRAVWHRRLTEPALNQWLLVAETERQIQGFVCAYGDDDAQWGTLVDNLHVSQAVKGQGIGTTLLRGVGDWVKAQGQLPGMYLWVFEDNRLARRFYENLGAKHVDTQIKENPGGGRAPSLRYAWPTGALPASLHVARRNS